MIDLSIVIASYEARGHLERCLGALARALEAASELAVEVLLVDNGSRDGSAALSLPDGTPIRRVALARNRGFAAAVNRGLVLARGRHVLLLNSDAQIEPDLLARGVGILDARPDIGILGARVAHPDGRPQRSVHALPDLATELLPEPLLRRLRPRGFERRLRPGPSDPPASPREVEAVRGAVLFVRAKLLDQIGLLDEGYFFFMEETDLCWRAREVGDRVAQAETLRARHALGASSKARAPLATRIEFHRSLYRFLRRRHGRLAESVAVVARTLRGVIGVIALALASGPSRQARRRLPQRWGLLLWHLRGRPSEPGLAESLEIETGGGESAGGGAG